MGAFILLDYLRKTRAHMRAVQADAHAEVRLSQLARAQHFLLMALFILLAYTGFVHKFPDAVWAWPFRALPNGSYVRGMIHRICGWTFAVFFLVHLLGLIGTRRGRAGLQAMWFVVGRRRRTPSPSWRTTSACAGHRRRTAAGITPRKPSTGRWSGGRW